MNETISFEVIRTGDPAEPKHMLARKMPQKAVMSKYRWDNLFHYYGQFLEYYTHTDSGLPELTFLCDNGTFTYTVESIDPRFLSLTLVRGEL